MCSSTAVIRRPPQGELLAIKRNAMERIEDLISKARAEGAEKLVPRTLASVEKQSRELDKFIERPGGTTTQPAQPFGSPSGVISGAGFGDESAGTRNEQRGRSRE